MRKHIFFKIVAKKIPKAFPNRAINSMFYNLFYSMFYNLKNMLNHVYFLPKGKTSTPKKAKVRQKKDDIELKKATYRRNSSYVNIF